MCLTHKVKCSMKDHCTRWGVQVPKEVHGVSGEPESPVTVLSVYERGGLGAGEGITN